MTATEIAKTIFLAASTVVVLAIGYEVLTLGETLKKTTDSYNGIPAQINQTLTFINRPGTGTLAEIDKLLLATKSLEVHADMVVAHEQTQLATLDRQEATLFNDLHGTALNAQEATSQLTATENDVSSVLRSTKTAVDGLEPIETNLAMVTGHADALVTDPDIKRFIAATADTTENVSGISKDGKAVADAVTKQYLAPQPWWKKALGWVDLGQKVGRTVLPLN